MGSSCLYRLLYCVLCNYSHLLLFFPFLNSVGAFCNFATSTTNFQELFPGIRSKLCTLNYHFQIPFYRECILSWGMISSKRSSIVNALTQSNNKLAIGNYDGYTSNAVSFDKLFKDVFIKHSLGFFGLRLY